MEVLTPAIVSCTRPVPFREERPDGLSRFRLLPCRRRTCPGSSCGVRWAGDARRIVRDGLDWLTAEYGAAVLVTLTAPSFGEVHGSPGRVCPACTRRRRDEARRSGEWDGGRKGRPSPVQHSASDAVAGTPVDPDAYGYAETVAWNEVAGDLLRRFIDELRRRTDHPVPYVCAAEFQRRGALHFHLVMPSMPSEVIEAVAVSVSATAHLPVLATPVEWHPGPYWQPGGLFDGERHRLPGRWVGSEPVVVDTIPVRVGFGEQVDVRRLRADTAGDTASYLTKTLNSVSGYLTKAAGDRFGSAAVVPVEHLKRLQWWAEALRHPRCDGGSGLLATCRSPRHRQLGYRGHVLRKAAAWPVTFSTIRAERLAWVEANLILEPLGRLTFCTGTEAMRALEPWWRLQQALANGPPPSERIEPAAA